MSDNSAVVDAMPMRRALQRCSGGPGCPCASHSGDSSSATRSPPSGSPSRSQSASTENTNSGDSINDSGSYRFTDSEQGQLLKIQQIGLENNYNYEQYNTKVLQTERHNLVQLLHLFNFVNHCLFGHLLECILLVVNALVIC
ncbi:unnamed protein product [Miscanthus lutarioriparius]|uniref:Uncharacterized protein n=1 Tax=Miscanthus lutarioriparius TaxID=422564 RepID=A0A811MDS1_9POAL|nr:unnamed protein product [Miscanthus lutarioriparius]